MNHLEIFRKLENQREEVDYLIQRHLKKWCEDEHPLKIGDRVEVKGYSFRGKEMVINHVSVGKKYDRLRFFARGNIVLKDGSVSAHSEGTWEQEIAKL